MKKLADWVDARLGHREALRAWLDHPIAGGASWARVIGSLLLFDFLLLALSGAVLMTAYAPSPQAAWPSVHHLTFVTPGGWLLRGIHHFASHAMIVLIGAHVVHVLASGLYRKPRELWFWLGLAMAGLAMGMAITGHLLPWDQKGWWARKVELGIAGMAPLAGQAIQQLGQGGNELGAIGLARAHALHVVWLPALFVIVVWLRARALRGETGETPYFKQLSRNIVGGLVLLGVIVALAFKFKGAPLEGPADYASDYPARPEWFLLPMFQLRRFFSGAGEFWGTSLVPGAFAAYLFALPLLDRSRDAAFTARASVVTPAFAFCVVFGVLGFMAVRHDAKDKELIRSRAKVQARAEAAKRLAMEGVPASGPLDMLRRDPETRGKDIFEKSCATCHTLGDLGDKEKATAPSLDGWSTEDWIQKMIHAPDEQFGKTPYKEKMPSVDVPKPGEKPMIKDKEEMRAVVHFLFLEGVEPGELVTRDEAAFKKGQEIFTNRCTTCHLYKGEGDDNGEGTAPEMSRYGSYAWTRQQIANPGTPATYREKSMDEAMKGHMPRFDAELAPADIDIVARWVRQHARLAK
jgi:ubiquinol-cytochrome c reductase cytochrome b subunit